MNIGKITTHSVSLNNEQIEKLYNILNRQGYSFLEQDHMRWKALRPGMGISVYKSGQVVIQGKDTQDFVLFVLEPEVLQKASLGYEGLFMEQCNGIALSPHIGIDESGKGDFFGPLVIGSVFVESKSSKNLLKIGVKDSKKIKNEKIMIEISDNIKRIVNGKYSVITIGNEAYNRLYSKIKNLNHILAWGHARALENLLLKEVNCNFAISDQFGEKSLIQNALLEKGKKIELIQKPKAESDIAVAAASILARAEFVRRMNILSKEVKIILPKGANAAVKAIALRIIKRDGIEKLNLVAKTHFKTYAEILSTHHEI